MLFQDREALLADRLSREVLGRGPEAALPQNLTGAWLEILSREADHIFKSADEDNALCTVLIVTRLLAAEDGTLVLPWEVFADAITSYAWHVMVEVWQRAKIVLRLSPLT